MMKLRIVLAATLLAASFGCGSSSSSPAAPSPSPSPTPSPTPTGTPVSITGWRVHEDDDRVRTESHRRGRRRHRHVDERRQHCAHIDRRQLGLRRHSARGPVQQRHRCRWAVPDIAARSIPEWSVLSPFSKHLPIPPPLRCCPCAHRREWTSPARRSPSRRIRRRYAPEGNAQLRLALRTLDGVTIADGDLTQVVNAIPW